MSCSKELQQKQDEKGGTQIQAKEYRALYIASLARIALGIGLIGVAGGVIYAGLQS